MFMGRNLNFEYMFPCFFLSIRGFSEVFVLCPRGSGGMNTDCDDGGEAPRACVGVRLVAVFLLVNSLGYFAVALYYLAVLLHPFSFLFSGVFLAPDFILYDRYVVFWWLFASAFQRNLVFQGWLLVSVISFYAALGVLLVFVARGLLRMRSWARRATMLHAALYPVFILVHFLTVWFFGDCLFNINLFSLFYTALSLLTTSYAAHTGTRLF